MDEISSKSVPKYDQNQKWSQSYSLKYWTEKTPQLSEKMFYQIPNHARGSYAKANRSGSHQNRGVKWCQNRRKNMQRISNKTDMQ